MAGYAGKFLRVNLGTGRMQVESVSRDMMINYVGPRGMGAKLLYDELAPGTDPLGPENKLIFLTGPLAGTNAQAVARWMVVTKSPLSDTFTRSVGGADFGAWLKFGGFDFIIFEGKAAKPVYLYIENGKAEIRDASGLWGKETEETQKELTKIHGSRVRAACIGPAGERLVRFAAIVSGRRTAARGGVGTVMGSKNLKAVAVNAPDTRIELHDPEAFKRLVRAELEGFKTPGAGFEEFQRDGTMTPELFNTMGMFPTRNFQYGDMDGMDQVESAEWDRLTQKHVGCYSCTVKCGKVRTAKTGPFAGATNEGPEYETMWVFNGMIDNTDKGAAIMADKLCDDLGLDSMSTGVTIALAYELFEKGIITKAETDGMELTWGNGAILPELVRKIAHREGFGNILAEGSKRAAERIGKGAEYYAMQVKGMELGGYDPRGTKAMAVGYATSNIGGTHEYSYAGQEIFGTPFPRPVDRFAEENKGDICMWNQDQLATKELGLVCTFVAPRWLNYDIYSKMLVAATGIEEFGDVEHLGRAAERAYNLERLFNLREGFRRKDDTIPGRFITEPMPRGGSAGQLVRNLDHLLDEYYEARGWTKAGIPTPEKLKELGLEFAIPDVEKLQG